MQLTSLDGCYEAEVMATLHLDSDLGSMRSIYFFPLYESGDLSVYVRCYCAPLGLGRL